MTAQEYLVRVEEIRNKEFITVTELVNKLGITYMTWKRLNKDISCANFKTIRKLKAFVEEYEKDLV